MERLVSQKEKDYKVLLSNITVSDIYFYQGQQPCMICYLPLCALLPLFKLCV